MNTRRHMAMALGAVLGVAACTTPSPVPGALDRIARRG